MRLRVIATDYDGTIAHDGVLSDSERQAIANARKRGVLVVIVTGRILSELRHVARCLDFVDGGQTNGRRCVARNPGLAR